MSFIGLNILCLFAYCLNIYIQSAMKLTFTKQTSSVLIKDTDNSTLLLLPSGNTIVEQVNSSRIALRSGAVNFEFNYTDVVIPAISSVEELFTELSTNFFFDVNPYTLIGSIDAADLNAATLGVTEIDFVFADAKQANFMLIGLAFKNTQSFVVDTVYGGYVDNSVSQVMLKPNAVIDSINTSGTYQPAKRLDDITVQVTLAEVNAKGWIAGIIEVYAELMPYPSI
jgi:hypothetical protein